METIFWQRFKELCAEKNMKPNAVMSKCGLNSGNPTAWKNGRIPGTSTMQVLAGFFSCPMEYLLGNTNRRSIENADQPEENKPEENETAQAGEPGAVSEEDLKFALFGGDQEITDEMYNEVLQFAQFVKNKNKK